MAISGWGKNEKGKAELYISINLPFAGVWLP